MNRDAGHLGKALNSLKNTKNQPSPRPAPVNTRDDFNNQLGEIAEFLDEDQDLKVKLTSFRTPGGRSKELIRGMTAREERFELHI